MICAPSTRRLVRSIAAALTVALVAPAGAVCAGDHDHFQGRGRGHGHGRCDRLAATARPHGAPRPVAARAAFVAPPRLTPTFIYSAHGQLAGDFYYRPHRHRHVVYNFPVLVNGVLVERPHVYCGGVLVRDAWLPNDGAWLRIGLDLPGLSIAAGVPLAD